MAALIAAGLVSVLLILPLAALAQPAPAGSAPAPAVEGAPREALARAIGAREWGRALGLVNSLLEAQPGDERLWALRGKSLDELDRADEAASAYERASVLAPNDGSIWEDLCWLRIRSGQWQIGRPACIRAAELVKSFSSLINLGHTFLLDGNPDLAYGWYREALTYAQSDAEVRAGRSDFELFARRGWQVDASARAGRWLDEADAKLSQARALSAQVVDGYRQARYDEVSPIARRALALTQEVLGTAHPVTAARLSALALLYQAMGRYEQALPLLQQALAIGEASADPAGTNTAASLINLALFHQEVGHYEEALPLLQRALAIYEKVNGAEHPSTATSLNNLGSLYQQMGRYEQALPLLQRALNISEKTEGAASASTSTKLNNLASLYQAMGRYEQSLPLYRRALAIDEAIDGPGHENTARVRNNLASLYSAMGRFVEALPLAQEALAISEKAYGAEHPSTAAMMTTLASVYQDMGRYEQALPLYERALTINEKSSGGEHPSTAQNLNSLARQYQIMGRYEEALRLDLRALAISEKANGPEHATTGTYVGNLASLYRDMGRNELALPLSLRALKISERGNGPDHPNTGTTLNNLAGLYLESGRYALALPLLERALAISEKTQGAEHPITGTRLNNLALLYHDMGRYEQALPLFQRALAISEKSEGPEHPSTGTGLNNLARVFEATGRYAEALPLYERALAISERANGAEHPMTGASLNNLAGLLRRMGRPEQALPLYQRALAISERADGAAHPATATRLNNLASLYQQMGRNEEALALYQRTLRVVLSNAQAPVQLSVSVGNLSSLYAALKQPELAIFFGKQAVNGFQSMRAGIAGLDKDSQQSFIKQYETYYSRLAGLLIDAGRLAEAQQVTAMLKEQELFELVRGNSDSDPRISRAGFTGFEAQQAERQQALVTAMSAVSRELDDLDRKARIVPLTTEEERRVATLEGQLASGRAAFDRFLGSLQLDVARQGEERRRDVERLNLTQARSLQNTLEALGHGAVLLHYVVLDDQLKIILTTSALQRGYTVAVDRKTLNRAIAAFREGIEERADVRRQARQLHQWLIGPVQAELDAAGTATLMLAQSDALRYLPFAALHDGEHWLAQRYALALYTEAARQNVARPRVDRWEVQAFGLTHRVEGFSALAAVRGELDAIVGAQGLPGRARFDDDFTARSFREAVAERPPVLHVASHFVFRPATEVDSFLLLGDGSRLSLEDLKRMRFRQVDLLTLSACNTALGGGTNENGREVEGFGALAQEQGVGAVLATLWPVADRSTAQFMHRFYTARQSGSGISKAEALQQAQSSLIEDPARAYAHPYFWAPFVLMGNWL